jgi:hypothetical protein
MSNQDIDWDGNCVFDENGKVVDFKIQSAGNHSRMRPIPKMEALIKDAKEADKLLSSIMQPATKEQISIIMKKLALHCGLQNKAPEEVISLISDYCHDLAEYPAALIDEAGTRYRKLPEGNNFMPSSGKLISMISEKHYKMRFMRKRIDQILGKHEEKKERGNKTVSLMDALNAL